MSRNREPLLVIAAMRQELAPLRRAVEGRRALPVADVDGVEGLLEGRPVVLAWSGEGPARAGRCAARLLAARQGELLVVGVAGALTADLPVGGLLVAREVVAEEGRWRPRAERIEAARRTAAASVASTFGTLVTVDRIVTTDAERARIVDRIVAGHPAQTLAVDMETAAFVRVAEEYERPWLAVRVVSDGPGDRLPDFLERCRRADGSIDRWRVAWAALGRPSALPDLLRLSRRVAAGARELAAFARAWAAAPAVADSPSPLPLGSAR